MAFFSRLCRPPDRPDSRDIGQHTLKNMALVHQSWTEEVQTWLRHRLVIRDTSEFPGLLKKDVLDNSSGESIHLPPTLGFRITDTPYFLRCSEGPTLPTITIVHVEMSIDGDLSTETWAALCTYLHRCPSLIVLVLRIREPVDFRFLTLTLPDWIQTLYLHFEQGVVHAHCGHGGWRMSVSEEGHGEDTF